MAQCRLRSGSGRQGILSFRTKVRNLLETACCGKMLTGTNMNASILHIRAAALDPSLRLRLRRYV